MSQDSVTQEEIEKIWDELGIVRTGQDMSNECRLAARIIKMRTTSKATTANPKDIAGAERVSLTKIPPVALIHMADAMMDGAGKYDAYNWRAKEITLHGYIDAALRHIFDFWEGEECAPDSRAKHLAHGMATLGIVIDAQAHKCLIDDRPRGDGGKVITEAMAIVKANEAYRAQKRLEAANAKAS